MIKPLLESSLDDELDSHLGLDENPNRRNTKMGKSLKISLGTVGFNTPRDRNSSYEPQMVKKCQGVLNDELIIRLYQCMVLV